MNILLLTLLSIVPIVLTPVAHSQVLGQPAPLRQQIDVMQFGHSTDRQFVICANADDCDAPLRKTLATEAPSPQPTYQVPMARAEVKPVLAPAASVLPIVSRAKLPATTKTKKKRIRAKRLGQCPAWARPRYRLPGSAAWCKEGTFTISKEKHNESTSSHGDAHA